MENRDNNQIKKSSSISEHDITAEYDCGMSHHGIIRSPLELFGQVQKGFGGFKEHFNVPTFSVDLDYFFIGQL